MALKLTELPRRVGNGVYSYYLLPVLSSIGIEGSAQQQGINGGCVASSSSLRPAAPCAPFCSRLTPHALHYAPRPPPSLQIFNLFISALASIYIQRFSRRFV